MKKTVLAVLSVTAMTVAAEVQVANRANLTGYSHRLTVRTPGVVCAHGENRCVYRVPAAYLGVDVTRPFTLEFKWSDNRQADDVMDFYVSGDAAPRGRLNYLFVFAPCGTR